MCYTGPSGILYFDNEWNCRNYISILSRIATAKYRCIVMPVSDFLHYYLTISISGNYKAIPQDVLTLKLSHKTIPFKTIICAIACALLASLNHENSN